ncbi:eukaryotic translation initiation factor 3 subunit G-like [Pistacia vera]|uniref:eukaryotic translation initiation factor 3 subunit G-like n=1 Tax=Pistacia vera TaxID=55513 RepID=UPI001263798A|nr:eukaryotic translation initiation factor 3 subunit G-like [Pistacia vera]
MATTLALLPKPRWSDVADDDDGNGEDLNSRLLPPTEVIGPDENGIKRVIEYKFNDERKIIKVTTVSRVKKIKTVVNKRVLERRSWTKFGDAVNEDVGTRLTVTSTEDILLERPKAPGSTTEEIIAAGDSLGQKGGAILMVCRNCGKKGDHWTARCPYKDLAAQAEASNTNDANPNAAPSSSGTAMTTYIPPSKRGGALSSSIKGSDMTRMHNDENGVKVRNISEDASEADLRDLFGVFGPLTRVHILCDRKTGCSRGIGFVNFVKKEDAVRAIQKLDGYGYDSLILRVEWAASRPN